MKDGSLALAGLRGDLKALDERMNTMQAQYAGALDRFHADMVRHEAPEASFNTKEPPACHDRRRHCRRRSWRCGS